MYTLGTALICCEECSLHRSASLTNFQFELLNYTSMCVYICICMYTCVYVFHFQYWAVGCMCR